MSKASEKRERQAEAIKYLREDYFPTKGMRVHTVIRHVARSGMSRSIGVLTVQPSGTIYDVSYLVARALDWPLDHNHGGVKVTGCGMDMAFHLVYTLARVLHGDGYALSNRTI